MESFNSFRSGENAEIEDSSEQISTLNGQTGLIYNNDDMLHRYCLLNSRLYFPHILVVIECVVLCMRCVSNPAF